VIGKSGVKMGFIYLDHNATTPVRPEVTEAMLPYLGGMFYNPSSIYSPARAVRRAIDAAREKVAAAIGADPRRLYFTSGGTEADNMALFGAAYSMYVKDRRKIVISKIEHPAVLESARALEKRGFELALLPVDRNGIVDPVKAAEIIDDNTIIVSVMHANNEIGTIQPIKELAEIAHKHGALMHSDCVQSFGKILLNVKDLGVDMASFSAHKIYGPKGIGAFYVRQGLKLAPLQYGGHQEMRVRPGTENPAAIIGFGVAAELVNKDFESGVPARLAAMRDRLQELLIGRVPQTCLNGNTDRRVPNTLNISFAFVEGEAMSIALDRMGIGVATGSACSSGDLEPSHVIMSMGLKEEVAHGSLRFSLGLENKMEEIEKTAEAVTQVVERFRMMSPLYEDFVKSGTGGDICKQN